MRAFRLLWWYLGLCMLRADIVHDPGALSWLASRYPQPVLWYRAAKAGDSSAHSELTVFATTTEASYWLTLSAGLGDARAFYLLANLASSSSEHKFYLQQGAKLGHAASQYDLALLHTSASQRQRLLKTSAEQGYLPAVKALYQWYLLRNDFAAAQPFLEQAAREDKDSALRLARLLWSAQEVTQAKAMFEQAEALGSEQASEYLLAIRQFYHKPISQTQHYQTYRVARESCAITLQPVADSLDALRNTTEIVKAFEQDNRLSRLPVCINPPVWLDADALSCDPDWAGQRRLGCDEGKLSQLASWGDFTHLMVMSTVGKANVNNGIMYLDLGDTYDVFVHELAHFVGFADEYPLSSALAARQCTRGDAPNLVIVQENEELDVTQMADWMAASNAIQLTATRTCNNHSAQAYKPVSGLTFMEFYDQRNIPDLYLALWLERLKDPHTLTPVYVNFAQYFRAQGDAQQSELWWQRFVEFRESGSASQAMPGG